MLLAEGRDMSAHVWLCLPVLLVCLRPAAAAPAPSRPSLAVAGDTVAVAVGAEVRWYDRLGRPLGRLRPRENACDPADGCAPGNRARADLARERALDDLDVPDELRERDDAIDLAEDELSLALRRDQRAGADLPRLPSPADAQAFVWADHGAIVALVDGRIWRIEAGRPAEAIGPAPAGIVALATTDSGLVIAARASEVLASSDGGRRFHTADHLPAAPEDLVVDPAGRFCAASSRRRLDVVQFGGAGQRPRKWFVEPSADVRDLAVCDGMLGVLADDGVHVVNADGSSRRVAPPRDDSRLGCAGATAATAGLWLAFGDHGLAAALDASAQGELAFVPVAGANRPVEAVHAAGDALWVFSRVGGLAQLGPDSAPPPPPFLGVRDQARDRPAPWHELLPRLGLLGRKSHGAGRNALLFSLMAEWRLGGRRAGGREATSGAEGSARSDLLLASAPSPGVQPAAPDPAAAEARSAGTASAPWTNTADPDAGCLARARARAVALAAAEPDRALSLMTRAGRSAWLPELRLRAERRVGRSESLDYKPTASSDALGLDTDNAVRYEVRATWDLPRLVFNPEEIGAAAQASRINEMRREIESQVNRLYYERRRLLVTPPAAGADDATTIQIRLEELEADLDALSGGAFARCRRGQHPEVP
jgi:hypothetical protein